MGNKVSIGKLFEQLFPNKKHILLVGLDHAGKTSILYKLKLDEAVLTIPTIGSNVETIEHSNKKLTIHDVGGNSHMRHVWKEYYNEVDAVIFVLDSNDRDRFEEAKTELVNMAGCKNLTNVPILVFANKQDEASAMSLEEINSKLEVNKFRQKIHVEGCAAANGKGLQEGLMWLSKALKS